MNAEIPIHRIHFEATAIEDIPANSFHQTWTGEELKYATQFKLAVDERTMLFSFQSNKKAVCFDEEGTFKSGLWEKDVAELFFLNKSTGRYQEFNFSPNGAYWSAVFSEYRKMEVEVPFRPLSICTNIQENNWEIEFRISLEDISIGKITDADVLLNVCSILYDPQPTFLSIGQTTGKPNFHKKETFCKINLL